MWQKKKKEFFFFLFLSFALPPAGAMLRKTKLKQNSFFLFQLCFWCIKNRRFLIDCLRRRQCIAVHRRRRCKEGAIDLIMHLKRSFKSIASVGGLTFFEGNRLPVSFALGAMQKCKEGILKPSLVSLLCKTFMIQKIKTKTKSQTKTL